MLWDEPKIFFLERRYFFSIILSEFLKNRVALQQAKLHAETEFEKYRIIQDRLYESDFDRFLMLEQSAENSVMEN